MEIWKIIKSLPKYEISSIGRIRNKKTGRILKVDTLFGYKTLLIRKNGNKKRYRINRLVAEAFLPNYNSASPVDHINRKRSDNRVENLRCVSVEVNLQNRGLGIKTILKIIELHKENRTPEEILEQLL